MSNTNLLSSTDDPGGERPCGDGAPARSSNEYEEFFSGTVPCPSCKGLGRIPKELEQQMVAIIPLTDKRLRPNRTYMYVLIAIAVCVVIGGLLMFFLLPRSIKYSNSSDLIYPRHAIINETERLVFLDLMMTYNVTNRNYYPIMVESMEVFSVFDTKVVGDNKNNSHLMVPMRATREYSVNLNLTFKDDEGYIAYYCSPSETSHSLLLPFNVIATATYMGHTEESTLTSYKHVECNPKKVNNR